MSERRPDHYDESDYKIRRAGGMPVRDLLKDFEDEGAPPESRRGPKKTGSRSFGYGPKATGKRIEVQDTRSRENRKQTLIELLKKLVPKREPEITNYRQWLEKVLTGVEPFSPEDVSVAETLASGPGGQHLQKKRTAVRASHRPTGLAAFSSNERSQRLNKKNALRLLRQRVEEQAQNWLRYEDDFNSSALDLFDETATAPS